METRRLGPLLAFSSPAQTRQLRDLLCRDDGPPKHATGCRHTHPAHKYSMKVVLGWNNASAAGERNAGASASRKGVFAEVTFWVHWGDALLRFPCSADVELPRRRSSRAALGARFLGSVPRASRRAAFLGVAGAPGRLARLPLEASITANVHGRARRQMRSFEILKSQPAPRVALHGTSACSARRSEPYGDVRAATRAA